jgi:hypothetical protein
MTDCYLCGKPHRSRKEDQCDGHVTWIIDGIMFIAECQLQESHKGKHSLNRDYKIIVEKQK